ncbi:hypothetical protein TWF970_000151 [Orbilia oligospora]|uniref:DUF726-domain-containing protein n=1 Tax=Orbilia oligospora TaxID=2813651 RepID=A0A7C8VS14_ORBOL|nr:hypothetical protein TWF970_000151 [Orbilia oligospora]
MPFGIGERFKSGGASKDAAAAAGSKKPQYDVDLVSLLTDPQRQDLLHLITAATEVMRASLLHTFDPAPPKSKTKEPSSTSSPSTPPDTGTETGTPAATTTPPLAKEEEEENNSSSPAPKPSVSPNPYSIDPKEKTSMSRLRHEAIASFDHWQQDLLTRIYDIMNPPDLDSRVGTAAHMQDVVGSTADGQPSTSTSQLLEEFKGEEPHVLDNNIENTRFPAIPTGLTTSLPDPAKPLILHSILLLILSLETYDARSRTLLRILSTSLSLPPLTVVNLEKSIAKTLVTAAKSGQNGDNGDMSADSSRERQKANNKWNRRLKIGIAGVAGAAVIGITGGLAAPLVAAGIGTVMSGIGLGATAAAGYLGALAGSGALVGALFGAYGGKMTGEMMKRYAQEVEDFGFLKVKPGVPDPIENLSGSKHENGKEEEEEPGPPLPPRPSSSSMSPPLPPRPSSSSPSHPATTFDEIQANNNKNNTIPDPTAEDASRLSLTIGISGWITDPSHFITPWRSLSSHTEVYALRWESTALMDLGNALTTMLKTYGFAYLKIEIIKRTVLATLMAALWPIALLKLAQVVDNPFNIVKTRAEKAGKILADALINRVQGNRPVTLVGYSLGSRVIYSALVELAERRAFGLVENVYMLGSAIPSTGDGWVKVRSVVSGRVVNVFSEKDYILGFLYRTSAVQLGVAGLQNVKWPDGVESVDMSESVEGHLRYRFLVGDIVGHIGGSELVDWKIVEEEKIKAEELKKQEETMEKEVREKEGHGEKELEEAAERIEKEKKGDWKPNSSLATPVRYA